MTAFSLLCTCTNAGSCANTSANESQPGPSSSRSDLGHHEQQPGSSSQSQQRYQPYPRRRPAGAQHGYSPLTRYYPPVAASRPRSRSQPTASRPKPAVKDFVRNVVLVEPGEVDVPRGRVRQDLYDVGCVLDMMTFKGNWQISSVSWRENLISFLKRKAQVLGMLFT